MRVNDRDAYFIGFSPRMMRIKKRITATTRRMWMNPPRIWKPKNPSTQSTKRMMASVVSINSI